MFENYKMQYYGLMYSFIFCKFFKLLLFFKQNLSNSNAHPKFAFSIDHHLKNKTKIWMQIKVIEQQILKRKSFLKHPLL